MFKNVLYVLFCLVILKSIIFEVTISHSIIFISMCAYFSYYKWLKYKQNYIISNELLTKVQDQLTRVSQESAEALRYAETAKNSSGWKNLVPERK